MHDTVNGLVCDGCLENYQKCAHCGDMTDSTELLKTDENEDGENICRVCKRNSYEYCETHEVWYTRYCAVCENTVPTPNDPSMYAHSLWDILEREAGHTIEQN